MRVAFYTPLVPVDHPTASGDRQMARQLLRLFAMAGHEAAVVSRLRSWSREPSEQHLAEIEARARARGQASQTEQGRTAEVDRLYRDLTGQDPNAARREDSRAADRR